MTEFQISRVFNPSSEVTAYQNTTTSNQSIFHQPEYQNSGPAVQSFCQDFEISSKDDPETDTDTLPDSPALDTSTTKASLCP